MANAQSKTWLKALIAILIIGALAFVIWQLTQPKTTTTSETSENAMITSMTCTAGDVENSVFDTYGAHNIKYTINLLFKDGQLDQLSYQYSGEYDSETAAEAQLPALWADYNLDLQDRGLTSTYFSGTNVGRVGNTLQISFLADETTLTPQVADYLMMDTDENGELPSSIIIIR